MSWFRRRLMMGQGEKEPPKYLCFEALESGTFSCSIGSNHPTGYFTSVSYSVDGGNTWVTANNVSNETVTLTTPTVNTGDKVLWKGVGNRSIGSVNTNDNNRVGFSSTGRFNVSGMLTSIAKGQPEAETVTRIRAYAALFVNCTGLVDASELILPTFTSAATCIFYGLFKGCTSLTDIPTLPTDCVLASECFEYMFQGCTSLNKLPSLSYTTLANYCYSYMFDGCTSLTSVPPQLPATTLTNYCYQYMFQGCTALTSVPSNLLPATTLKSNCYRNMFSGCTSLTNVPNIPATTLGDDCCRFMFGNCSSIEASPALLTETLVTRCYYQMLYRCTSLTYIKMLATDKSATNCMYQWLDRVPNVSTSIFVKHINATWTTTGTSGVPTNWTVIYYDPTDDKYYTDQQKTHQCDDHGNIIS